MIVSILTDVLSMAWGICNMESGLDTISVPAESESLIEAALDILGEVTATAGRLAVDLSLDRFDIRGEISDIESIVILHIPVGHKANSHRKALASILHVVDDLT